MPLHTLLNPLAAPNLIGTNTGDAVQGTALLDFGAAPGGTQAGPDGGKR